MNPGFYLVNYHHFESSETFFFLGSQPITQQPTNIDPDNPGLHCLSSVDKLLVKQEVEFLEAVTGIISYTQENAESECRLWLKKPNPIIKSAHCDEVE